MIDGSGFLIVGLRHCDRSTVLNPSSETTLSERDVVIVLGREGSIPQLVKKFQAERKKIAYRGVSWESS